MAYGIYEVVTKFISYIQKIHLYEDVKKRMGGGDEKRTEVTIKLPEYAKSLEYGSRLKKKGKKPPKEDPLEILTEEDMQRMIEKNMKMMDSIIKELEQKIERRDTVAGKDDDEK